MSRRHTLSIACIVLFALFAAPASKARPGKKATATEREASAYLTTLTGVLQPLRTVANQSAWLASTDVTPEHTAARAAADKALAAVSGSKVVIEKTRALLAHRTELD